MTCRYSHTDWLDVLYNSVRRTPGGVADAARFLTERRGKSIHPESLRAKLRGVNGDEISLSMADLLTEWMEEKAGGEEYARDWVLSHASQHRLHVDAVPPAPEGGWACEMSALKDKCLKLVTKLGKISGLTTEAAEDGKLTEDEAGPLLSLIRSARVILHRMERNILRAVSKGRDQ